MTNLKIVMDAFECIEAGKELTEEHRAALRPVRAILNDKLKPKGKIPFRHSVAGYLIGPTFFKKTPQRKRAIYGLQCNQWILQEKKVPSITLWSRDTLSKGGLLYRHLEPGVTDGTDWTAEASKNPYQTAKSQLYYEIELAQRLLRRLDELNELPKSAERERKIMFIEGELRRYRYKRKIKSFDDEVEKARKNVQKAIKCAITWLIETPETAHIGLHLQETIKTGFVCEYRGNWMWKF